MAIAQPRATTWRRRSQLVRLAAACVVLGVSSALTACGPGGRSDPQGAPSSNVVLILLDTVRADRLGSYGSTARLTPALDAFAEEGVIFEQAFSHAPWTLPSVASIFTSQQPVQHGAGGRLGSFAMLRDEATTLAEVFRDAGARTAAITNVLFLTKSFGMTQGFDEVDSVIAEANHSSRRARDTTDTALAWLSQHETGHREDHFFLLVHYFDAHLTYDPPQPFRRRFASARDAEGGEHIFGSVDEMIAFRKGEILLDAATIARLEKLYDGEVAYLDHEVGRLLEGISDLGLDESSIIVVTSDHGEEFLDHGGFEHGHTLYDEQLRVPLIMRLPSSAAPAGGAGALPSGPKRIAGTARLIDLAPTLCDLVGVEPAAQFKGASLVPALRGERAEQRPVLSHGNMWGPSGTSWRRSGYKLMTFASEQEPMLFAVATDPGEKTNVALSHAEQAAAMSRELEIVLGSIALESSAGQAPELTPEQAAELRALGYTQ